MEIIKTSIPEVIVFVPPVFTDSRGYFLETYQQQKYAAAGIPKPFVQDNQSYSTKNVLRGLHFQLRHPQGKLVREEGFICADNILIPITAIATKYIRLYLNLLYYILKLALKLRCPEQHLCCK